MVVENEKAVLSYCPNFNKIVNFEYTKEDRISCELIRIYKDYIFKANIQSSEEVKRVHDLDYVIGRYIDDYEFRRELKTEILHVKIKRSCTDILRAIVESILHIFENYLENSTRKIRIARWI